MKACTKCGESKSLSEYHNDKTSSDRHSHRCKECAKAITRLHRKRHLAADPFHFRQFDLKKFGLTHSEYTEMLLAQGSGCAICGTTEPGGNRKNFCVDHSHVTDKVRGLLCIHCNMGIGQLADSPERLEAAARYLREHA